MTSDELAKLTPEEKRIKIAEACQWHSIKQCTCKCQPHGLPAGVTGERNYRHLPDYLNDLNAMHEAEKAMDDSSHKRFRKTLWIVTTGGHNDGYEEVGDELRRKFVSATAAQRADAFLLTVG